MRIGALSLLTISGLAGCLSDTPGPTLQGSPLPGYALTAELPVPVTNNAVASVEHQDRILVLSFMGLGEGKTWRDTYSKAWLMEIERNRHETGGQSGNWQALPDVPGPAGRLAAAAVTVAGKIYIFGGYTVAEDGSEKSVPLVHMFDPLTWRYSARQPMPVPVDDTVALVYLDRYVYLVSGWHDTDNVELVQVYDTRKDAWFSASAFPGPAVFGHAGGITGNEMVVCDGVKVVPLAGNKRTFTASRLCYRGTIDNADPSSIAWRAIAHYPQPARYRMAAGSAAGLIYFAGGSDNPYNYDGIGYDGNPSVPSAAVFAFDPKSNTWLRLNDLPFASMDHRGLVNAGDGFFLVGGMGESQEVLSRTVFYRRQ
ncbi:MAG: galactose oxidase [Gammaproteobacteria bacterium]|nr:galactose oxidase [Gammaproteobacteria bacterium]